MNVEPSGPPPMKIATTTLFFCVAALLALGMVMLFSASTGQAEAKYLFWQPVWCLCGLVACWAFAAADYRWLKRYPWIPWAFLAFAALLLGFVLIPGNPFAPRINGARRWIRIGHFTVQSSELAKLALIIALAHYGERSQRYMPALFRGMLLPATIIGVVLGLVFLEPDVGTPLLLGSVSAILLLIAGIRWRYFLPPVCIAAVAVGLFLWQSPMRSGRIYSWLHVEETKQDKGLQAYHAMVALGSGGVTGVGLGDGRQKLGFLPEHHTDFIFSVIGEELGLVATLSVLLAFLVILICGISIAFRAPDTFGLLLGSGLSFLIGLQAFINIGVVTSALPNKGLPLPFISYGGSNLLIMLTAVGILLSIARQARPAGSVDRAN